jgi:hypothetical protein
MSDLTRRLHGELDAELDRLPASSDPPDSDEPELGPFATRLHSLRNAVAALELRDGPNA